MLDNYRVGKRYYCSYSDRYKISLTNKITGKQKHLTYARYLMCVKLGRMLLASEHVHHKDGNQLNDDETNLELLTIGKHNSEHKKKNEVVETICFTCGKPFKPKQATATHWAYKERHNMKFNKCCSLRCATLSKQKLRESKQIIDRQTPQRASDL